MARRRKPDASQLTAIPLEEVRRARGEAKVAVSRSKLSALRAFRRLWSDRVMGMFGVFLILGATLLIFFWVKPVPVEPKVTVAWRQDVHGASAANGTYVNATLAEGETQVFNFEIKDLNVTRVRVNAYWVDDVAVDAVDLDNFTIQIEGPPKANASQGPTHLPARLGTGSNQTFSLKVQDPPNTAKEFPVRNVEEAAQLLGDHSTDNGTGVWKVTVTLSEAKDHYGNDLLRDQPCPDGSPAAVCIPDHGNWIVLRFEYATYRPQLAPA